MARVKDDEVVLVATSRWLVAVLFFVVAGCSAPPARTATHHAPLLVSALTAHGSGCTEVDAYSATCVGN